LTPENPLVAKEFCKIIPASQYELKMIVLNHQVKKIIVILTVLAALAAAHAADTNTVQTTNAVAATNPVIPVKKTVWQSQVSAGLTLTRGNSDTVLFVSKIQTQNKQPQNEWLLEADSAYGENNSVLSEDILHGSAQYNHIVSERFYGYGNLSALHDGIQDLAYQVSLSPGAGYYFIKTLPTSLVGEIGPGIICERRGEDDQTYMSLRLAEHWDQKLNPTAKLWEKVEVLPEATKFDNYIVNSEFGVETSLTKRLSLQVTFDDNFVNEPAAGRKNNDARLVSSIVYKF
jgi:putative salt-induced outer membrane protein YdiY